MPRFTWIVLKARRILLRWVLGSPHFVTSLDTARNVNPPECVWDGVFVPYLANKCGGGHWRSGMGDIPIPKEKTEQGTRSLEQPRISLAGHQLVGIWGNPCSSPHISVLLILQSSSLSWKRSRLHVSGDVLGGTYLPCRAVCCSRYTWCTGKSIVMVYLPVFPCWKAPVEQCWAHFWGRPQ